MRDLWGAYEGPMEASMSGLRGAYEGPMGSL
jgi:hypothetical protein